MKATTEPTVTDILSSIDTNSQRKATNGKRKNAPASKATVSVKTLGETPFASPKGKAKNAQSWEFYIEAPHKGKALAEFQAAYDAAIKRVGDLVAANEFIGMLAALENLSGPRSLVVKHKVNAKGRKVSPMMAVRNAVMTMAYQASLQGTVATAFVFYNIEGANALRIVKR